MRQICVAIADRGAAEFAVGHLIVELISSDGNWEAIMIGLKALLSIYMSAPARAAGRHVSDAQVGSSPASCLSAYSAACCLLPAALHMPALRPAVCKLSNPVWEQHSRSSTP